MAFWENSADALQCACSASEFEVEDVMDEWVWSCNFKAMGYQNQPTLGLSLRYGLTCLRMSSDTNCINL
jgi:hypothetical protein